MKNTILFSLFSLMMTTVIPTLAFASRVAVVDSGTDFKHSALAGRELVSATEIIGNRVDDDRNGKVDDIVGWNFIDQFTKVFFRDHLTTYNPIIYPLFTIIAHKQAGLITEEEAKYWTENVDKLPAPQKAALQAHLQAFGGYAHGTHCSGIVAALAPEAKIMSARVFADDIPNEYETLSFGNDNKGGGWTKYVYKLLSAVTNGLFDQVAVYLTERKVDVANYSLGTPLHMIAKALLQLRGIKNPTPEQLSAETKKAFVEYEKKARAWMTAAPQTLFVIAAGNDGTDNDVLPTFPSNVNVPNAIRVAASLDYVALATFSNYGKTTVDVAAPGVAIVASVPSLDNTQKIPMSGTSMAAPFVTGVAAHVKDINPALTPAQLKAIIMGTVDKKPWLEGKVVSGGVVNPERAYEAARESLAKEITVAIEVARTSVADVTPAAKFKSAKMPPASTPQSLRLMGQSIVF